MSDVVCYCFGHSVADIEQDVAAHGRSTILERIVAARRIGGCQCASLHPKGS